MCSVSWSWIASVSTQFSEPSENLWLKLWRRMELPWGRKRFFPQLGKFTGFDPSPYGHGSIPMKIPFLMGWTSINPSYFDVHQGYKVLTHPHMVDLATKEKTSNQRSCTKGVRRSRGDHFNHVRVSFALKNDIEQLVVKFILLTLW